MWISHWSNFPKSNMFFFSCHPQIKPRCLARARACLRDLQRGLQARLPWAVRTLGRQLCSYNTCIYEYMYIYIYTCCSDNYTRPHVKPSRYILIGNEHIQYIDCHIVLYVLRAVLRTKGCLEPQTCQDTYHHGMLPHACLHDLGCIPGHRDMCAHMRVHLCMHMSMCIYRLYIYIYIYTCLCVMHSCIYTNLHRSFSDACMGSHVTACYISFVWLLSLECTATVWCFSWTCNIIYTHINQQGSIIVNTIYNTIYQ